MVNSFQIASQIVKERDHQCLRCQKHGTNVHHRKLRSQCTKAEVHALPNLIYLCGSGTTGCHGWAHHERAEAERDGFIVPSWRDPEDVPVKTFDGWRVFFDDGGYSYTTPPPDDRGAL